MSKTDKVILVEKLGRSLTFNLPHESYCAARGECSCRWAWLRLAVLDRQGNRKPKKVRRRICASVLILANGESDELPRSVLELPEVLGALGTKPPGLLVRNVE